MRTARRHLPSGAGAFGVEMVTSAGLLLSIPDVSGKVVRLDVRRHDDVVELHSPIMGLASFSHECLREWLTHPAGQLVNSAVSFRWTANGIVLDIGVLFVSHVLNCHEINFLKGHVSTSEMDVGPWMPAHCLHRTDPTRLPDPEGGDASIEARVEARNPSEAGRRIAVEVVTVSGRAASVEFRLLHATVEIWHRRQLCAVFDRRHLRSWLATPGKPLLKGPVELCFDRTVDRAGRVALSLPDVNEWTLSPTELEELRAHL